jgi:hypothetical protein
MLKQVVLKGVALTIAPCLVIVACLWLLAIFINFGYPPCENDDWLQIVSHIVLPVAFAVAAGLMIWAASKNIQRYFFAACAIAIIALLTTWLAYQYDARNQKACAKRSLSEAVKACKADPKYVRRGVSPYGNPTFTLISPGDTYEVTNCLQHWSVYNGSISLVVGQSVP